MTTERRLNLVTADGDAMNGVGLILTSQADGWRIICDAPGCPERATHGSLRTQEYRCRAHALGGFLEAPITAKTSAELRGEWLDQQDDLLLSALGTAHPRTAEGRLACPATAEAEATETPKRPSHVDDVAAGRAGPWAPGAPTRPEWTPAMEAAAMRGGAGL